MFRATFNISTRQGFVEFAEKFGEVLRKNYRGKPWCVDLHGDHGSGKSLIALGVDKAFNPHLYPDGITEDIKVDPLPSWMDAESEKIYFYNFNHRLEETRVGFDDLLTRTESAYPSAKVLIFNNIVRSVHDDFHYCSNDLNSGRLDIYVDVRRYPKDAPREVTLVTDSPEFKAAWPHDYAPEGA